MGVIDRISSVGKIFFFFVKIYLKMIFFPIICASLFIALPRIISAAPVSEPLVIDNNQSVSPSVEISPLLGLAWPGHYDEEIAWNEGETKSKDEESGNYEDNQQNQNPGLQRSRQLPAAGYDDRYREIPGLQQQQQQQPAAGYGDRRTSPSKR